ncbi:hypothetical protein QE152_g19698 [Popillia japonica]|uniref:Uncharacterized protein n=1 Tax=Popillia japonica TaxID=7064 RepID=A0AAW1KQF2_POPJA
MENFDESSLIRKHIRSINFLKNVSSRTPESPTYSVADSDGDSSSRNVSGQSTAGSEKADTIRSCESIIKVFRFETKGFNQNNEKCLAFWNALNNRDDIMPVNCTIMDAQNNKRTAACQTEEEESEASLWARALLELRKRKLDKVALAAASTSCKFCQSLGPMSPILDPGDLQHDQDLTELDCWSPHTMNKATQFSTRDISLDVATSVNTDLGMVEPLRRKSASSNRLESNTIENEEVAKYASSIELNTTASSSLVRPTFEQAEFPLKVIDIDETEENESFKVARSSTVKPTALRKQVGKFSEEYIDKRKVSIADVVKVTITPRTGDSSEVAKARGSVVSSIKESTAKKTDSKLKSSIIVPASTAKRVSISDVSINTDIKRDVDHIPPAGEAPKEVETQRKSSLKCRLSMEPIGGGPIQIISHADRAKVQEFRKLSQKIEESIALSNLREKDIMDKERELNSIVIIKASNPSDSNDSSSKNSRVFSKSDAVPRKQISFYGETSPRKKSMSKTFREDSDIAGSVAPFRESVIGTSLTNIVYQKQLVTAQSTSNLVDETLGKRMSLSEDNKINKSQTSRKASMSVELSPRKVNEPPVQQVQSLAEDVDSNVRSTGTDTPYLTSLLHPDTLKSLTAIANRKKALEDELRKHKLEDQTVDRNIYLCPCLRILEKTSCTECSCIKGICLKPSEEDLKKIDEFFDHLPERKKSQLKCFSKALVQIRRIMKQDLDQATADQQILEVLTGLGPCECEGDTCECQLHHLDIDNEKADYNFIAATMLQKFNSILDERLEEKLGIKLEKPPHLRNQGVETETFIESTSPATDTPQKIKCNVCKEKDCVCVTK